MNIQRKKLVIVGVCGLLVGFIAGFIFGGKQAIDLCARLASDYVSVDQDKIAELIKLYGWKF